MLYWAFIFLIIGVIAAVLGFGGVASTAFGIAKGLVLLKVIGIILILCAIGFFFSHTRRLGHS